MAAGCHAAYGAIDVLHNNVGILELGGPVDITEEAWDRVHDVNLKSMFLTCKHVLPVMEAQGGGAIVNISSVSGLRWTGVPYLSYSTSKAAVISLTKTLALALGPDIRVNAVAPGWMEGGWMERMLGDNYDRLMERRAKMTPLKRCVTAEDVADTMLSLVQANRFVTGEIIVVDGGFAAST